MVAYAYENLGGISSVSTNPKIPHSKRGRDRDRFQNYSFTCDPENPFSGTIYLQGSVDAPPQLNQSENDLNWFDVAQIDIIEEGGTFFLQTEIELSMVRVVCRDGDYNTSVSSTAGATTNGGQFSIDGISISVNIGDDATAVVMAINSNPDIILNGTIFAEVTGTNNDQLRIYNNTGSAMVLTDDVSSPLEDIGIIPGTFSGGNIQTIKAMR